jgi:hypothetical protein
MGNKNRRPPKVVSPKAADRAVVANVLGEQSAVTDGKKKQGNPDFEALYGSTEPESFSVEKDIKAVTQEGIPGGYTMLPDDPNFPVGEQVGLSQAAAPQTPPPMNIPEAPQMPPQALQAPVPPQGIEEPQEDQEGGLKLTDDPRENCRLVSETIGKIMPNPPAPETLYGWKMTHGDIFLLNIGERVFVYRYLKRQEWMQMNANPQFAQMTELQVEDMIFNKCVLWPGLDVVQAAALPANTVGMIVQQIRIQSYFLDPGYVATLTLKI